MADQPRAPRWVPESVAAPAAVCVRAAQPDWHTPEIYDILRRYNAAYCIFEIAGFRSGFEITADFTYVRLHGPGAAYRGSYPAETLREWAARIRGWQSTLRAIYVYFDNDQAAYAVENALALKKLLG